MYQPYLDRKITNSGLWLVSGSCWVGVGLVFVVEFGVSRNSVKRFFHTIDLNTICLTNTMRLPTLALLIIVAERFATFFRSYPYSHMHCREVSRVVDKHSKC